MKAADGRTGGRAVCGVVPGAVQALAGSHSHARTTGRLTACPPVRLSTSSPV